MARRSDHTREEIREMAVRAGQAILREKGLSGFSARQVAKDIGYTVGTLFNVFGSYDAIILQVNAATLDDLEAFMAAGVDKKTGGEKAVRKLAERYVQFAREHYLRWSALFEHRLPPETPLPEWYQAKVGGIFAMVEAPLIPLMGRQKAAHAARVLWASVHGICELGLSGKLDIAEAESVDVLVNSLIRHYLAGLTHA